MIALIVLDRSVADDKNRGAFMLGGNGIDALIGGVTLVGAANDDNYGFARRAA